MGKSTDHRSPVRSRPLQDSSNSSLGDNEFSLPVLSNTERSWEGTILSPSYSRKVSDESNRSATILSNQNTVDSAENMDTIPASSLMYYPTDDPASGRPYNTLQNVYKPDVSDISDDEESPKTIPEKGDPVLKYPRYDFTGGGVQRALVELYGKLPIVDRKPTNEAELEIYNRTHNKCSQKANAETRNTSSVSTSSPTDVKAPEQANSAQHNVNDPNSISEPINDENTDPNSTSENLPYFSTSQLDDLLEHCSLHSSRTGKIKDKKTPSPRAHPYKGPSKCELIPRLDENGVLVYRKSDCRHPDPKLGALVVLGLCKVSNLGNKEDVWKCQQTLEQKDQTKGQKIWVKKNFVLRFFPVGCERFNRERDAKKRVKHPSILSPLSLRILGDISFTVSNFCSKGSLATLIGKLPITDIVRYFIKIANALLYLHNRNVFHRDLRPENIMIDEDGNPKIADFDLSDTLPPSKGHSKGPMSSQNANMEFKYRFGAKVSTKCFCYCLHSSFLLIIYYGTLSCFVFFPHQFYLVLPSNFPKFCYFHRLSTVVFIPLHLQFIK